MNIEDLANYFASATINFEKAFQQIMIPKSKYIESFQDCASIIIISSGRARFTINETSYELKTGSVLHVGPSMDICEEVLSDAKCSYIVIQYRILDKEVRNFPIYTSHFILQIENQKKIFPYLPKIRYLFARRQPALKSKSKIRFVYQKSQDYFQTLRLSRIKGQRQYLSLGI